jgi:hypothetical protein
MRMVMTSPNVLRNRRPDWLAPYNFFLFPLLSSLEGYPLGFDKTNFHFITPTESDRKKWNTLKGINLRDGRTYQISMVPDSQQKKVLPDSFQIIWNQYLRKPEVKSLGPDGNPCIGTTQGLLGRTRIVAGRLIPVAKETDRRWVHGEDPSMLDFEVEQYQRKGKMVVADLSDRRRWRRTGVRNGMRRSGLSQKAVSAILNGEPVRIVTLAAFRRAMDV